MNSHRGLTTSVRRLYMKNQNIPLAIILKKVHNGYQFQQLQKLNESKTNKNKKGKPPGKHNFNGRTSNRLIKQIGLSNQQIQDQILNNSHFQQQSHTPLPNPHLEQQPHSNMQVVNQIVQEQEVSCQIQRQDMEEDQILPKNPAKWFDTLKAHQIQKSHFKNMVHWQDVQTNPTDNMESQSHLTPLISQDLYLKYRNFIYEAYLVNPKRYLTKISCRRVLRGDVNTIHKVHQFLQEQGIINYGLGIDGNYCFKPNPLTKQFQHKIKPQTCLKSLPQNDQQTDVKQIDTDNMTLTVINKNFSRTFRAHCNDCKLVCGIVWFANICEEESSQKNMCFECFNAKVPQSQKKKYQKIDIIKKMQNSSKDNKNSAKASWNIDDNLKLLDFMSHSQNKSWSELIDQFQGKKSIQDVILQYMQFPISNFQPNQVHKSFSYQKVLQDQQQTQFGYQEKDYQNILRNFFNESEYYRQLTDLADNKDKLMNGTGQMHPQDNLKVQIKNKQPNLKSLISLMNKQMLSKLQIVSERQKLIDSVEASCLQLNKAICSNSNGSNKAHDEDFIQTESKKELSQKQLQSQIQNS